MREGRIPAQGARAFDGSDTLSRDKFLENGNIIHQNDPSQPLLARNYLNHSPEQPKLFVIPSTHKPRAKIVQETNKKLAAAYDKPKSSLKTLQIHDENGHRVRSQRREAAIALLQVMNYYQDDASGRIGRKLDDGTFRDYSLKTLAEKAGIALRRAIRALKDITRAGYLKVIRQFIRDPDTGKVTGLASIRSFTHKLFTDLCVDGSLWTKWFSQRGYASERAAKKITKQDRKKARAMMGMIKEGIGNMGNKAKGAAKKFMGLVNGISGEPTEKQRVAAAEQKKKVISKALEMFNLDPSKTVGEYLKALQEAHPPK